MNAATENNNELGISLLLEGVKAAGWKGNGEDKVWGVGSGEWGVGSRE